MIQSTVPCTVAGAVSLKNLTKGEEVRKLEKELIRLITFFDTDFKPADCLLPSNQIKESRPKTTIQGKKMDLIEIRAAQKAPFCCKDIMRPAALELII